MTTPIEKEISVLAGGAAVIPGTASKPLLLDSTDDMNNVTEPGFYVFNHGTTAPANAPPTIGKGSSVPAAVPCSVFVFRAAPQGRILQYAFCQGNVSHRYSLATDYSTWGEWHLIDAETAGHGVVHYQNISANRDFDLETEWSNWKGKIVLFGTTAGNNPRIRIRRNAGNTWNPPVADQGAHIVFHPLWKGGRVEIVGTQFARHNSNGRVVDVARNSSGVNATEGVGEPFRLIFDNYYIGNTLYSWHVAPMVQDVQNVIDAYDHTVVHLPELKAVESKVDHLIVNFEDSAAIPYWETFNLSSVNRHHQDQNHTTFGSSVKIKGTKGESTLFLETTFSNGSVDRDSLGEIVRNESLPGTWVGDTVFIDANPTVNAMDNVTTSSLTFSFDRKSGRMNSPLPADIDITLTETATQSSGAKTYRPFRFTGYTTALGDTQTNVLDTTGTRADSLRLFGSSTDLTNIRDMLDSHLGTNKRAVISFEDTAGQTRTFHVTALGTVTIRTALNTALNHLDLTVAGVTARTVPANRPAGHLRPHLQDIAVLSWATDPDEKIPTDQLPVGSGGNNLGDLVATSANITMAVNGDISPLPNNLTWTIPNTKTSHYTSAAGAFIMPTDRVSDAHNGWIFQILDASDNVLGEGMTLIGRDDGVNIVVEAETGKHVEIVIENIAVASGKGIGAKIFSSASNSHGGARSAPFVFKVRAYEWIDTATYVLQSSSSGGSEGTVGGYDILRREEAVSATLSGRTTDLGGSGGYTVDEGATHLEVSFDVPSTVTPGSIQILYQDPDDTTQYREVYEGGEFLSLTPGETKTFRFSSAFFHGSGSSRTLRLRASAASDMSGTLSLVLEHEKDVNSAAIEEQTLLDTSVTVPAQTIAANLSGAVFSEVGLETPIEWDRITSLSIFMKVLEGSNSEDAEFVLVAPKDMMDYVGDFGDTDVLPSSARINGYYSVGWSANGHQQAANTWSKRPSAAYVYYYTNSLTQPSRLVALKRTGVYLTDILVASWRQQCIVEHVSCMRRI